MNREQRIQDEHDHIWKNELPEVIESLRFEIADLIGTDEFEDAVKWALQPEDTREKDDFGYVAMLPKLAAISVLILNTVDSGAKTKASKLIEHWSKLEEGDKIIRETMI